MRQKTQTPQPVQRDAQWCRAASCTRPAVFARRPAATASLKERAACCRLDTSTYFLPPTMTARRDRPGATAFMTVRTACVRSPAHHMAPLSPMHSVKRMREFVCRRYACLAEVHSSRLPWLRIFSEIRTGPGPRTSVRKERAASQKARVCQAVCAQHAQICQYGHQSSRICHKQSFSRPDHRGDGAVTSSTKVRHTDHLSGLSPAAVWTDCAPPLGPPAAGSLGSRGGMWSAAACRCTSRTAGPSRSWAACWRSAASQSSLSCLKSSAVAYASRSDARRSAGVGSLGPCVCSGGTRR